MNNARILALVNVLLALSDHRTLGTLTPALKARLDRLSLLANLQLNDLHLLGVEKEFALLNERLLLGLRHDDRNLLLSALQLLGLGKRADALLLLIEARCLLLLLQQLLPERLQGQLMLLDDLRSLDRLLLLLTSLLAPDQELHAWGLNRTSDAISVAHLPR